MFVLVFSIQVPMYGVAVLLYAVLQAHKRFFWPAFAPVMSSIVVIATYVVYAAASGGERNDPAAAGDAALNVLAWGTTLGVAAMCLPMFVPVHRLGVRLRPTLRFPAGVGRRLAALAFAGVGSLVAQQLALLVVLLTSFARGSKGTFSVFLWTQQVYLLPYAVLVVPLATSTFPRMAARAAQGRHDQFARMASGTTRAVLAAATLGGAAVAAAAPAVADVFGSVAQDSSGVAGMAPALTAMIPGLLGFAVMFHGSRSLYALERGRAAVAANVAGWGTAAVATVVAAVAATPDGHDGAATLTALGVASSVGMLVGGVAVVVALRRAGGAGVTSGFARTLPVLLVGGVVGAVAGRWVCDEVGALVGHHVVSAIGAAAGGGVVAALVVVVAIAVGDRGTVRDLRAVESQPAPTGFAAATPDESVSQS
jgi:putative peptidoglycan lipid II flippase